VGTFDLILGLVLLGLSALTGGLRVYGRYDLLGWLQPLQAQWGERRGNAIHLVAYTVSPAILGASFVLVWWMRG